MPNRIEMKIVLELKILKSSFIHRFKSCSNLVFLKTAIGEWALAEAGSILMIPGRAGEEAREEDTSRERD